jgi:hypothetical protein
MGILWVEVNLLVIKTQIGVHLLAETEPCPLYSQFIHFILISANENENMGSRHRA